ncbi:hypothetical protein AZF37_08075 [endosymbiont 'TC1' of Trimyema compressum]|uniref:hypothetical protein n=1 Tax=endosymbiont 'TC1' of Trimyema compressum TaxID=243899 RepID=UPI0007F17D14|nr:hypothetical protein [endosymbiont 'TC1' of Trimyema compressum]AMP21120.1 hypothetical protein AZF37_08075 [endosymbiont 'TC1' of Trimyema compressum]
MGTYWPGYIGGGAVIVFPFKIDVGLVLVLSLIAAIVGMLAGFLPANKGAKISPLDEIRKE